MKYCKKCKKEYPENRNFCEDCGNKLVKFIEHIEKPKTTIKKEVSRKVVKPKISFKKFIIPITILVIVAIFLSGIISQGQFSSVTGEYVAGEQEGSQPSGQPRTQSLNPCANVVCNDYCSGNTLYYSGNCVNGQCQYANKYCDAGCSNNKCCHFEQEAYTTQEPYQVPLIYSVIDKTLQESWNIQYGFYYEYKVTVANGDNVGGSFRVDFGLSTSNHGYLTSTETHYIPAHSTYTFSGIFDTDMGEKASGSFVVSAPTKTEYKTVTKYRTVTKCD